MPEPNFPAFRNGSDIDVRFAPNLGVIECSYTHLKRTFGLPTYRSDNNDVFEGNERCVWMIQFENGPTVSITEHIEFGMKSDDEESDAPYVRSTRWRINSNHRETYQWVKSAIIYSNPQP